MKIKINGRDVKFFNQIAINRGLDQVASTFSFVARYNPANPIHKDIFEPLGFPKVEIFDDNDELILTGTVINFSFKSQAAPSLVQVSGYSLPGVLEDCTVPVKAYPLEGVNRSLKDVAEKLLDLFNLSLVVDPGVQREVNTIYSKTVAEPTESIKEYLSKLAAQRNIVVSHNAKGQLVFFRPNVNAAALYFFNSENSLSMELSVVGQNLHSEISVLRQPSESVPSGFFETIKNTITDLLGIGENDVLPRFVNSNRSRSSVINSFRPKTVVLTSGTGSPIDSQLAVKNHLASELKNIVLTITLNKIIPLNPGDIVEVENVEVYLNTRTRFMVAQIRTQIDTNGQTMSITCLLPEAFTGEQPKQIFSLKL